MSTRSKEPSEDATSTDSDSKKGSTSGTPKRRPSRIGTRSVSTLSAAQLERKRANDREAQRAIRQRTKEHIEKLEKRIAELSSTTDSNEHLVATLKRNKELEDENALLKMQLEQARASLAVTDAGGTNWDDIVGGSPISSDDIQMTDQQQRLPNTSMPSTSMSTLAAPAFSHSSQWHAANSATLPVYVTASGWKLERGRSQPGDYGFNPGRPGVQQQQAPELSYVLASSQYPAMHGIQGLQRSSQMPAGQQPRLSEYGAASTQQMLSAQSAPPGAASLPARTQDQQQAFYGHFPYQ